MNARPNATELIPFDFAIEGAFDGTSWATRRVRDSFEVSIREGDLEVALVVPVSQPFLVERAGELDIPDAWTKRRIVFVASIVANRIDHAACDTALKIDWRRRWS